MNNEETKDMAVVTDTATDTATDTLKQMFVTVSQADAQKYAQEQANKRADEKKRKDGVKGNHFKHIGQQSSIFWFKFYAEQCGWRALDAQGNEVDIANNGDDLDETLKQQYFNQQVTALSGVLASVASDPDCPFYVHGIVHKEDELEDLRGKKTAEENFWKPSIEKPHAHLLLFSYNHAGDGALSQYRLGTIINYLEQHGLHYRNGFTHDENGNEIFDVHLDLDTKLLLENGVLKGSAKSKDHIKYLVYHTHETDTASETQGKHKYARSECFTNIPDALLNSFYDEYFTNISKKWSVQDEDYVNNALIAGRNILDRGAKYHSFTEFWREVPYKHRKNQALRKNCLEWYNIGVSDALSSDNIRDFVRCAIYIQGDGDIGKSYNSSLAMRDLGRTVYEVVSGGTGKLDDLDSSYGSLIVSDSTVGDIFAMTDNAPCRAYRRGSNNPVFTGDYLIITSNEPFLAYMQEHYSVHCKSLKKFNALMSRFFICDVSDGHLILKQASLRGTETVVKKRIDMFKAFKDRFELHIAEYESLKSVDGSFSADDYVANLFGDDYQPMGELEMVTNSFGRTVIREKDVPVEAPLVEVPLPASTSDVPAPTPVITPPNPLQARYDETLLQLSHAQQELSEKDRLIDSLCSQSDPTCQRAPGNTPVTLGPDRQY